MSGVTSGPPRVDGPLDPGATEAARRATEPTAAEVARVTPPGALAGMGRLRAWTEPSDGEVARLVARGTRAPRTPAPAAPEPWGAGGRVALLAALLLLSVGTAFGMARLAGLGVAALRPGDPPAPVAGGVTVLPDGVDVRVGSDDADADARPAGVDGARTVEAGAGRVEVRRDDRTSPLGPGARWPEARSAEAVPVVRRGAEAATSDEATSRRPLGRAAAGGPATDVADARPAEGSSAPGSTVHRSLDEASRAFTSLLAARDDGAAPGPLLDRVDAFRSAYAGSALAGEADLLRLELLPEALPPRVALAELHAWTSGHATHPRYLELRALEGSVAVERLHDCALGTAPLTEVAAGPDAALAKRAAALLSTCAPDPPPRR